MPSVLKQYLLQHTVNLIATETCWHVHLSECALCNIMQSSICYEYNMQVDFLRICTYISFDSFTSCYFLRGWITKMNTNKLIINNCLQDMTKQSTEPCLILLRFKCLLYIHLQINYFFVGIHRPEIQVDSLLPRFEYVYLFVCVLWYYYYYSSMDTLSLK